MKAYGHLDIIFLKNLRRIIVEQLNQIFWIIRILALKLGICVYAESLAYHLIQLDFQLNCHFFS